MDKTLQITFYNSETNGIKILEFTKGEIIGFFIPKIIFNSDLLDNSYFKNKIINSGIYFLSGEKIYIGQALNLFERLKGHIREGKKEFEEILCFTTTNNSFDEGDINFLERTIIKIAKEDGDFNLMNLNNGNNTNIKEFRKSDLSGYVQEIKFLLNILGYRFLEKYNNNKSIKISNDIYRFQIGEADATMKIDEKGYLLLSGSSGRNNEQKSMVLGYKKLKNKLIELGIIKVDNGKIKFVKDHLFSSSTAPAQILLGYSVSGPEVWRNENNGKNLKNNK
ncbi:DUF4357 domain-containing protein [Candidatus Gracilibacteria bacterium]|nr:DUF4357 domain-containing protein [Candidatus Gracilibacteria bacterium]